MSLPAADPATLTPLSADERARYARQLILPEVGPAGQRALRDARVLVVGAGGLGSPVALYLAAAGVGTLGLVDFDTVDTSNLHRQLLHDASSVGMLKTESAARRIHALNEHVRVERHDVTFDAASADALVSAYDVVVDGTDNFDARYAINDACVQHGVPLVSGSVERFAGQVTVLIAAGAPCYRCLFPLPPAAGTVLSCAEAGVLGVVPGIIGTLQATEVLKLLLGAGDALTGRLLLVDALAARFETVSIRRRADCAACGDAARARARAPRTAQARPADVTPRALAEELQAGARPLLLDVREPMEWDLVRLADAVHVPLGRLQDRLGTIPLERDIVVYCHHGTRSAMAAEFLREQGATRVRNLSGGIDRWSRDVDPSLERY
ncbi:MAG: molybdopterin biosynthesis protein MoeB [Gemmatimonadetes bacterium]|nr:molybdopterin biosynthesis protein MoeB [Gemmatimonadota bacterium]